MAVLSAEYGGILYDGNDHVYVYILFVCGCGLERSRNERINEMESTDDVRIHSLMRRVSVRESSRPQHRLRIRSTPFGHPLPFRCTTGWLGHRLAGREQHKTNHCTFSQPTLQFTHLTCCNGELTLASLSFRLLFTASSTLIPQDVLGQHRHNILSRIPPQDFLSTGPGRVLLAPVVVSSSNQIPALKY